MRQLILLGMVFLGIAFPSRGASFYPARLNDAAAVYLTPDQFSVRGDGNADDSTAIQAAIDKVQETTGEGILFIPQGRYRVTRTIYVWPGVRLIGYGEKRPVFVLADGTPGFQEGVGCMFFFAGFRPNRGAAGRAGPGASGAFPGRAFFQIKARWLGSGNGNLNIELKRRIKASSILFFIFVARMTRPL